MQSSHPPHPPHPPRLPPLPRKPRALQLPRPSATDVSADSARSLASLLLSFVVVIVLLESGGLLTWADRLELGPLRRVALPIATVLHDALQPLGIGRVRTDALAALARLRQDDAALSSMGVPQGALANVGAAQCAPGTATPAALAASAAAAAAHTQPAAGAGDAGATDASGTSVATLDADALASVTLPTHTPLPPLSALAPDKPRVVALVGDSMMAVGLSSDLLRGMATHVNLKPVRAFRSGTGLARPDVFDWMSGYPDMLDGQRPDVVIVALGANDSQGFVVAGKTQTFGSDAWIKTYETRLTRFLDLLTRQGAQVVWLGLPPMRMGRYNDHIDTINRIAYRVVSQHPRARWWNTAVYVADARGRYRDYARDPQNRVVRLRAADGIHLSDDGAQLLSAPLLDWLDPPPAASAPSAASEASPASVSGASGTPAASSLWRSH